MANVGVVWINNEKEFTERLMARDANDVPVHKPLELPEKPQDWDHFKLTDLYKDRLVWVVHPNVKCREFVGPAAFPATVLELYVNAASKVEVMVSYHFDKKKKRVNAWHVWLRSASDDAGPVYIAPVSVPSVAKPACRGGGGGAAAGGAGRGGAGRGGGGGGGGGGGAAAGGAVRGGAGRGGGGGCGSASGGGAGGSASGGGGGGGLEPNQIVANALIAKDVEFAKAATASLLAATTKDTQHAVAMTAKDAQHAKAMTA